MRSRAFRRFQHQKRRRKALRLARLWYGKSKSPRVRRMIRRCINQCDTLNNSPNRRNDAHNGTKKDTLTPQEVRAEDAFKEQLEEVI